MFKRVMARHLFCNIQDLQGNIQVYVARDDRNRVLAADFKKIDIGDIFEWKDLLANEEQVRFLSMQRR